MKNSLKRLSLFAAASVLGCSYNARAPEQYRADTAALLETQNAAIKQCYDNILRVDPGVSGRVAIKFTVQEETGEVTTPAIDSTATTAPEPLAQCVLSALTNLKLVPPDENTGHARFIYEFQVNQAPSVTPSPS
ncbi:MAG TPA: AgmX/PglI C-terminal domain-containing protein [Polyangiaceae bacterium]